jgi:hypothetical protein
MKKIKLLTAGLLAITVAGMASASTEIRITGSTAFRKGTVDAIERILNPGFVWGSTGGSGFGANQQIFVGVVSSSNASDPGDQVIIKCSWSGSAGGIQSLAQNLPAGQAFIIDPTGVTFGATCTGTVGSVALTAGTADLGTDSANIPAGDITESHTADAALSDAFQESTPFGYPGQVPAGLTGAIPNIALTSTPVAIVPFEFVASAYSTDGSTTANGGLPYPGVTNMTLLNAQELIAGGVQLSQITGSTAAIDANTNVFNVGRDHDSGTRITLIYDNQFNQNVVFAQDTGYTEPVTQYIPNGATINGLTAPFSSPPVFTQFESQTAGSGVVLSVTKWPSETVIGENRGLGQEGFFSGSSVAGVLNRAWNTKATGTSLYDISNLGFGDAPSVNPGASYTYTDGASIVDTIKPSKNALLFNGVYPGTALHNFGPPFTNIEQGTYSFWGVEHFLTQTSLSGSVASLAAAISGQVVTQADYLGIGDLLTNMTVGISADGQQITPGFTETE